MQPAIRRTFINSKGMEQKKAWYDYFTSRVPVVQNLIGREVNASAFFFTISPVAKKKKTPPDGMVDKTLH